MPYAPGLAFVPCSCRSLAWSVFRDSFADALRALDPLVSPGDGFRVHAHLMQGCPLLRREWWWHWILGGG
eukprot:scaffold574_cov333-Pavlova_lutheri.AAC.3